jgi:hypothetical protein
LRLASWWATDINRDCNRHANIRSHTGPLKYGVIIGRIAALLCAL